MNILLRKLLMISDEVSTNGSGRDSANGSDELIVAVNNIPRSIYRTTDNFPSFNDTTFSMKFRVIKFVAYKVLQEIKDELDKPFNQNEIVSPMNQLLIFLRVLGTGTLLAPIADFPGTNVSIITQIIKRVARALANKATEFIKMPKGSEIVRSQRMFYGVSKRFFSNVIGAIATTNISIQHPRGANSLMFISCKGDYQLRIQIVSSADLKILNIVNACGTESDSHIFNCSRLCLEFENDCFPNSALLGDDAFSNKSFLMTPLGKSRTFTGEDKSFDENHRRTWECVEKLIHNWKKRFPILTLGGFRYPETALEIIQATAVIHNICQMNFDKHPPEPEDIFDIRC